MQTDKNRDKNQPGHLNMHEKKSLHIEKKKKKGNKQ